MTGTKERPRLNVFRSLKHIYAQIIDDLAGKTLVSASDQEVKIKKANKTEIALAVGKLIAQKAQEKKIKKVIFDRSGYKFHGRIKAVAQGAKGVDMGRNIWQSRWPVAMISAIRSIVHEKASLKKAYNLFNSLKNKA